MSEREPGKAAGSFSAGFKAAPVAHGDGMTESSAKHKKAGVA